MDVDTYIFIFTINSQTTIQNCLTKFIPLPINFRISKLCMYFQNLIFVDPTDLPIGFISSILRISFEAYMAMYLVWKGRQLIIHLFSTVWIVLISKVGFCTCICIVYLLFMCVHVYEYVYTCVHVCVDAQSQLWMSTQLLYFIYWGRVSCWSWSSLLSANGVSWQVLGLQSTSVPARTWVLGPDSGPSCLLRKLIQGDISPVLKFLVFVVAVVVLHSNISTTVFFKSKHLDEREKAVYPLNSQSSPVCISQSRM